MRRGAKPAKPQVDAAPPVARKSLKSEGSRVRDLENRLAEARAREKATGEILRVIGSSPADLTSVLDAIAANAARRCECGDVIISLVDGQLLRVVAGLGPFHAAFGIVPIVRGSSSRAAARSRSRGTFRRTARECGNLRRILSLSDRAGRGGLIREESVGWPATRVMRPTREMNARCASLDGSVLSPRARFSARPATH
jgi:hypothetical protein